jgi:hypothetical protein
MIATPSRRLRRQCRSGFGDQAGKEDRSKRGNTDHRCREQLTKKAAEPPEARKLGRYHRWLEPNRGGQREPEQPQGKQ